MVYGNSPVRQLQKIRDSRVMERRAIADGFDEAPDIKDFMMRLTAIQDQIDALDRAIDDEEKLSEG